MKGSNTTASQGHFVTPHAFELADDGILEEEFFGPILHIVRFKSNELRGLPKRINNKGYGLTFGLQTRQILLIGAHNVGL